MLSETYNRAQYEYSSTLVPSRYAAHRTFVRDPRPWYLRLTAFKSIATALALMGSTCKHLWLHLAPRTLLQKSRQTHTNTHTYSLIARCSTVQHEFTAASLSLVSLEACASNLESHQQHPAVSMTCSKHLGHSRRFGVLHKLFRRILASVPRQPAVAATTPRPSAASWLVFRRHGRQAQNAAGAEAAS